MGRSPGKLEEYKEARRHPKGPVKRLFSIPEAAHYLGRSVDSLREIIWSGKMPIVRNGRRIFLDIRDMDAWIEKNKETFLR